MVRFRTEKEPPPQQVRSSRLQDCRVSRGGQGPDRALSQRDRGAWRKWPSPRSLQGRWAGRADLTRHSGQRSDPKGHDAHGHSQGRTALGMAPGPRPELTHRGRHLLLRHERRHQRSRASPPPRTVTPAASWEPGHRVCTGHAAGDGCCVSGRVSLRGTACRCSCARNVFFWREAG